jgi:hypothetical protein
MRVILVLVVAAAVVCTTDAKRKRKFDGDFEFAEEVSLRGFVYAHNGATPG